MKQSELAKIFKALSSEQRLKLFIMIYEAWQELKDNKEGIKEGLMKQFSVACDCFSLSRSTISHHFKELEQAGLIECRRNGQSFCCYINEDALEAVRGFLK